MSTVSNKYDVNPGWLTGQKDIISHIIDIRERVSSQETGLNAGHTAIEDGNFVVRNGDIIVSETDDVVVLKILHGEQPEIQFFPLGGTDTHLGSLFGYDYNGDPDSPDQAMQLYIARVSDLQPDGGKVLLSRARAVLSHQPFGSEETFIWLDPVGFWFQGNFSDQVQGSSLDAIYTGAFTATSGFTTWTHTYFTPFASNIIPIFTVGVNGTTIQWGIEGYSTSAFVIRFSTTSGNKFVTFWNVRL